jgi:hypothetical protein
LKKANTAISNEDYVCCIAKNQLKEIQGEMADTSEPLTASQTANIRRLEGIIKACENSSMLSVPGVFDEFNMNDVHKVLTLNLAEIQLELDVSFSNYQSTSNIYVEKRTMFEMHSQQLEELRLEFERSQKGYADNEVLLKELKNIDASMELASSLSNLETTVVKNLSEEMIFNPDRTFNPNVGLIQMENIIHEKLKDSVVDVMDYIPKLKMLYEDSTQLDKSVLSSTQFGSDAYDTSQEKSELNALMIKSTDTSKKSKILLSESLSYMFSVCALIRKLNDTMFETKTNTTREFKVKIPNSIQTAYIRYTDPNIKSRAPSLTPIKADTSKGYSVVPPIDNDEINLFQNCHNTKSIGCGATNNKLYDIFKNHIKDPNIDAKIATSFLRYCFDKSIIIS